ncbi:hypothetical protein IFR05_012681 [Cadophora sp. M221]|nr:hypothetical protein IFR05_012681 [Cadophora sp. M221]
MLEELEKANSSGICPSNASSLSELREYYMDMTFSTFQTKLNEGSWTPLPGRDQIKAKSEMEIFRSDDLHLSSLMELAQIEVHWTADLTEHLGLENYSSGHRSLTLYWFRTDPKGSESIYRNISHILEREMENTMRIILGCGSNTKFQRNKNLRAYASTQVPPWSYPLHKDILASPRTMDTMMRYELSPSGPAYVGEYLKMYPPHGIGGIDKHLHYSKANSLLDYSLSQYTEIGFEPYDSVKPKGIRGLFRDDRNSMVIFGTTSVILALASLIVSSLQTLAVFHPPNYSANKTSR